MNLYEGGKKLVQYGDNIVEVNEKPVIKSLITTIGVKPSNSTRHEYLRRLLVIILICIMLWEIMHDHIDVITLEDLEPAIKKDSLMYQAIQEIDGEEAQQKYLRSLKNTLESKEPTLMKKYSKSVKMALMAGLCSEYIISGNIIKPMGIIAKTISYATIYAIIGN